MKLNLFGRLFSALLAGFAWAPRWPLSSSAIGSWTRASVTPSYRHGKTSIVAAKRRARKSRNRQRHHHGRA